MKIKILNLTLLLVIINATACHYDKSKERNKGNNDTIPKEVTSKSGLDSVIWLPLIDTIYKPYLLRSDTMIFSEERGKLIIYGKRDTTLKYSITFCKPNGLHHEQEHFKGLKDSFKDEDYMRLKTNYKDAQPTDKINPFDNMVFVEIFKYNGGYYYLPQKGNYVTFDQNYFLTQNMMPGCYLIQDISKSDSITTIFSTLDCWDNDSTHKVYIHIKKMDDSLNIFLIKKSNMKYERNAFVAYYTPLEEVDNFKQILRYEEFNGEIPIDLIMEDAIWK